MKSKHDLPCTFRLSRPLMAAVRLVLRLEETLTGFVYAALVDAVVTRLRLQANPRASDALREAIGLPPIFVADPRELTPDEAAEHPPITCENGVVLLPYVQNGFIYYRLAGSRPS